MTSRRRIAPTRCRIDGAMMRAALIGLLLLAGCSRDVPEALTAVYRDAAAPIASKALFDVDAFAGEWQVVARYPVPFEADCAAITAIYVPQAGQAGSADHICWSGDADDPVILSGAFQVTGPGRMRVTYSGLPPLDVWVLWTDDGYRTAVLGTPDGRAGWILNREAVIPADRLTAAREVLDFNGFDLNRLVMVPRGSAE